jgi:hypothetical protein
VLKEGPLEGAFNMTSNRKWSIAIWIVLILGAVVLRFRSCSSSPNARLAQEGVAQFRSQMEAGDFQAIYAEADEGLRRRYDSEDFVKVMAAVDRGVGTLKVTRLSRARESLFPGTNKYVTLEYETTWTRTKGEEKFTFLINQGRAVLDTYYVYAPYPK